MLAEEKKKELRFIQSTEWQTIGIRVQITIDQTTPSLSENLHYTAKKHG